MNRIEIYDTTLRDGTQGEGISFSVTDKLLITERLDQFGADYIEGGFPGSNPRDITFFAEGVFQDGTVAKAVNSVVASGALYFSAAGNEGRLDAGTSGTWEGDFVDSGAALGGGTTHNFGGRDRRPDYERCLSPNRVLAEVVGSPGRVGQ